MASTRTMTVKFIGDERDLSRAFRNVSRSSSQFGRFASRAILGAGTGIAAGIALAIKSAGDFEQQLNVFQATAGATAGQMHQVAAVAKQLGADTRLPATSAKDAADAMTELAKGGLSVRDAMQAARGVLQLSAAAQISNADAAQVTADSLNAFGLKGREAAHVADILAAAANASTASIPEMADALKQSSAVAKIARVSIEDTSTALTVLANAGLKGSDAGTSLKTTLLALIAPQRTGAKALKELGISAFDQAGKVKPLAQILANVRDRTKGMSEAQRDLALKTIFGTDAFRAAAILLGQTPAQYEKVRTAVTRNGAAQDLASAQTKGFNGAINGLKSSLETLAIEWGTQVLPTVTQSVQFMTAHTDVLGDVARAVVVAGAAWGTYKAAVVGVAAAQKIALVGEVGLAGALGASPVALAAGAVVGLAGAFYFLSRGESAAERHAHEVADGFRKSAQASRAAAAAIDAQKQALDALKGRNLDVRQARLQLAQANQRVKDTEKGTSEHTQALIDQQRQELMLRDAVRQRGDAQKKAVETSLAGAKKADEDVKTAQAQRERAHRAFAKIVTKDAFSAADYSKQVATAKKNLEKAERQETAAAERARAKHLEVAATAHDMAGAIGGAGANAATTRKKLEALAAQEFNLSQFITAFQNLSGAARDAAGNINAAISAAARAATAAPKNIGKLRVSFERPRRAGSTAAGILGPSRALAAAGPRSADDATFRAEEAAKAGGDTNPEIIRLKGEKAANDFQIQENNQAQTDVANRLRAVRRKITTAKTERSKLISTRRTIPKRAYTTIQYLSNQISKKNNEIDKLEGEEIALIREGADLIAEATRLGVKGSSLEGEINKTPAKAPAPDTPTQNEVNAAIASTTPGLEDDVAAQQGIVSDAQAEFNAAVASGDPQRIIDAAGRLNSSKDTLKQLLDALNANTNAVNGNTTATEAQTESFTGTVGFGYRGQSYLVGQSSDNLSNLALGV